MYNIQSLFRVLPQHTVALRCAKALELPQNGFLRGNQGLAPTTSGTPCRLEATVAGMAGCKPAPTPVGSGCRERMVVGVTGLEPATSSSQTTRASNCATPRRSSMIRPRRSLHNRPPDVRCLKSTFPGYREMRCREETGPRGDARPTWENPTQSLRCDPLTGHYI